MTGYRIWPALLLAVVGGVGAAVVVLADVEVLPDGDCPAGLEWAAVAVVPEAVAGEDPLLADYRQRFEPILAGCLDADGLTPAEVPDPRS